MTDDHLRTGMPIPTHERWDREVYSLGLQINQYPFDAVVAFVNRFKPAKPAEEIRILEIVCGVGNNIWFFTREGYIAYGIDASSAAIHIANTRLNEEGLSADLRLGTLPSLPWADNTFDLAVDRGTSSYLSMPEAFQAIREVYRCLVPGGVFYFNPYSVDHTREQPVPCRHHYSEADVLAVVKGWIVLEKLRVTVQDAAGRASGEWRVVLKKPT